MDGLECSGGGGIGPSSVRWPFDPLIIPTTSQPADLLLFPRLKTNPTPTIDNNKFLNFSTLNLNSSTLSSPFDINISEQDVEDINNNCGGGLMGVSFLTLDPLVAEELAPTSTTLHVGDSPSRVHILRSCFPPSPPPPQQPHPLNNTTMSEGIVEQPVQFITTTTTTEQQDTEVDDVEGIYFSIHDLDQYSQDGEGDKGYLIEDLMSECTPSTATPASFLSASPVSPPCSPVTTPSSANSNSFDLDQVDMDEVVVKVEEAAAGGGVVVEGEKMDLKCKFCGFVCCSKSSLGIHERRHTGERPYACKHCGRLFNSAQCCKHHERLHTGDKPFECQYCGKKYAVSTRLKRHERVHTREEPYKCGEPDCGKTFRWFDAFRDHRNTHNGVALYLCSVCGKSFTSYLKFYYHERGHFLKRERDKDRLKRALEKDKEQEGTATPTPTHKKSKARKVTTPP